MSKHANHPLPVLEWSKSAVRLFDPVTRKTTVADRLEAIDLPKQVILALSRRTSFLRTVVLPNAKKEDLRMIVALQLANHFPIPAHELAFDFHPTDETLPEGRRVLIVGTRLSDLSAALDAVRARGSQVAKVVPTSLGSALVAEDAGLDRIALLEDTPEGIGIDLVDGKLTRVSRLSPSSALGGLAAEVDRSYLANDLPRGSVVSCGGLEYAEVDRKVASTPLEGISKGYPSIPIHLELPSEIAKREEAGSKRRTRFAVLAALSALLLGALAWDEHDRAVQVVKRGEAKWSAEISKLNKIKTENSGVAAKLTTSTVTLERALKPAQRASDVLQSAADAAPEGVWLTGINFERGKAIQIRGSAKGSDDVKLFLNALEASPRFRDVKLAFANTGRVDDINIVQFSVTAMPIGNLPYVEPERKKRS